MFLVLLIGLGVAGYLLYPKLRQNGSNQKFRTMKVERGEIRFVVTASGTINPVITVLVGSQVSGTIKALYADFNSQVKEGQVIAQIDPAIFEAQVDQGRANVLNAQANLLNVQASLQNAQAGLKNAQANLEKAEVAVLDTRRTLDRNLELIVRKVIAQSALDTAQANYDSAVAQREASKAQVETARSQIESAKAQIESAKAQIEQARASLRVSETNLRYATIRSPVNGIVISRNVDVGQTVAASLQAPTLFTIAKDLTRMQVDTNVSEADIGRVTVSQEATFTVDAYPERTFPGRVLEIRNAPTTIQNVVTYDVVIQVKNPELKLRPGMTANASILVAQRENALKILNAALRFRPEFAKKEAAAPQKGPAPPSTPSPSATSPEQLLERLKAELKLTPEQQAGISRILKDAQSEIQAARKAGGSEEAKAKAKELRAANRMKIRSLLTEEQKKKYDLMDQRSDSSQGAAPVYKVWAAVPEGRPAPVDITTGISDGSYTEVVSGSLKEGQEIIVEAMTGDNKGGSSPQATQPSMRGFR